MTRALGRSERDYVVWQNLSVQLLGPSYAWGWKGGEEGEGRESKGKERGK